MIFHDFKKEPVDYTLEDDMFEVEKSESKESPKYSAFWFLKENIQNQMNTN